MVEHWNQCNPLRMEKGYVVVPRRTAVAILLLHEVMPLHGTVLFKDVKYAELS